MTAEETPQERAQRHLQSHLWKIAAATTASGTERMVAAIAAAELQGYSAPADVCNVVNWLTHRN